MNTQPTPERAAGAQGKHTPTPWRMKNADGSDYYNEHGPTWYAVPSNRSEEFGSRWVWFVADVDDFNEQDLTGNCLAECRSLKEAQALVTACNTHARLVEALADTERTLRALASSELTIDEDRNRTPLRLAQRNDVWRAIESACALLSEIGGGK